MIPADVNCVTSIFVSEEAKSAQALAVITDWPLQVPYKCFRTFLPSSHPMISGLSVVQL
jgi:hypothetical protein